MKQKKTINFFFEKFLKESIEILSEATLDQLKDKYVGTGPIDVKVGGTPMKGNRIPEEIWNEITGLQLTFGNKSIPMKPNYVAWLASQVAVGRLKEEDIYKYGDTGREEKDKGFISLFMDPKHKKYLDKNDITLYKDSKDLEKDVLKAQSLAKKTKITTPGETDEEGKYVTKEEIGYLKDVGIELLGVVSGYQCFKVPQGNNSEETWKVYNRILGRCSKKMIMCTFGDISRYPNFKEYVGGSKADDLYVFVNTSDPDAPYQFHYRGNQFMDVSDQPQIV